MKAQAKAKIQSGISHWYLWLFPVFALGITLFLMRGYITQRGPVIEVAFETASALQPEKTKVLYKGVPIGTLKDVHLSKDRKGVIAKIRLYREAKDFATEGTKFWIVTPKVTMGGVTGLDTIFKGAYIGAQPGEGGQPTKEFKGKMTDDSDEELENTSSYQLESSNVESINAGDTLTYRGLNIGKVTSVNLSKTAQTAHIVINVENKHSRLVRTNTVFWRKVAVQAKMGLFGGELKLNSVESMLRGGIELATPSAAGPMAKAHAQFVLQSKPPQEYEKWNPKLE